MNVGFDSELEGISDSESAGAWLRRLSGDPGARLDAIRALLERLSESASTTVRWGPKTLNGVLEVLRVDQWRSIVARVEPLAGRPVPFTAIEWPLLHSALASLHVLRNLYKRVYAQSLRAAEVSGATPAARDSMAGVLPLIRALDAQSRAVALQLQHRCVPQAGDWDELCVLARGVRRTSFQDESVPDEVPLVKPSTARALFVYPLLLECASLSARVGAEAEFAQRLAARLASRVGYRIDHGAPRDNEHGPRMALTADYAVRLDTHRVPDALARWRRQWFGEEDATKPGGFQLRLPEADSIRVLADLERCWARGATPRSTGAHPVASATIQRVRLRFGLPKTHSADLRHGAAGVPTRGGNPSSLVANTLTGHSPNTGGENRYEYGRWEQNTIIRLAFGTSTAGDGAMPTWIGESEPAARLADRPDGRTVIARESAVPRCAPGALISLEIETDAAAQPPRGGTGRAATGPGATGRFATRSEAVRSIALGTVEAIEQLPTRDGQASRAHRLVVRLWAGQAIAVGVRVGDSASFEDAWLLRGLGASSELPCLVLPPGRARGGDPGVLREPGAEVAIRFVTVLDRGTGYERLSMRTESGRDAH